MDRDEVKDHKLAKKEGGQCLAVSSGHGSSPVSAKAAKGHASNRPSNNHGTGSHITHIDLTANFGDGPFRPALVQGKAITNGQGRLTRNAVLR